MWLKATTFKDFFFFVGMTRPQEPIFHGPSGAELSGGSGGPLGCIGMVTQVQILVLVLEKPHQHE